MLSNPTIVAQKRLSEKTEIASDSISDIIKAAIHRAHVLTQGHFIFADGAHATLKLEMDNLWKHPEELKTVLHHLAERGEGLSADVVLGVPSGGQQLADGALERGFVARPIAHLERVPGGAKQDFRFCSEHDEQLVRKAQLIVIYEDVVSTMSSIAGVVRLLNPAAQEIHAVAIWRRGTLLPPYSAGIVPHFLVEEEIPMYSPDKCPVCMDIDPSF